MALVLSLPTGTGSATEAVSGWPVPFHDPSGTSTFDGRGVLRDPWVRWTHEFGDVVTTARIVTAFGQIAVGTRDGTVLFLLTDT